MDVASEFNRLPTDLLIQIFSYFGMRPRMLVVSLVCRRWRAACLRVPVQLYYSQTRFLVPKAKIPLAARVLQCIDGMSAVDFPRGQPLPQLSSLRAFKVSLTLCKCRHYTSLTTLRHLKYHGDFSCNCFLPIITANTLLTSLHIIVVRSLHQPTVKLPDLRDLCLPNLKELLLSFPNASDGFTLLIRNHASQLTSLSLKGEQLPPSVVFPKLTHLTSVGLSSDPLAALAAVNLAVAPSAPNLRCLTLDTVGQRLHTVKLPIIETISQHLSRYLVSLDCAIDPNVDMLQVEQALSVCSLLSRLHINRPLPHFHALPFATRLQSLALPLSPATLPRLAACNNLTQLGVKGWPAELEVDIPVLSSLQDLTIDFAKRTPEQTQAALVLRKFIASCPRLSTLTCRLQCDNLEVWPSFYADAEKAGLLFLTVAGTMRYKQKWLTVSGVMLTPYREHPDPTPVE